MMCIPAGLKAERQASPVINQLAAMNGTEFSATNQGSSALIARTVVFCP